MDFIEKFDWRLLYVCTVHLIMGTRTSEYKTIARMQKVATTLRAIELDVDRYYPGAEDPDIH